LSVADDETNRRSGRVDAGTARTVRPRVGAFVALAEILHTVGARRTRRRTTSDASEAHGGRMKSILDPSFHYTSSANTDVRKTFARVRRELRRQQEQAKSDSSGHDGATNVSPMFQRSGRGPRNAAAR
jgi:hypothetical protein